MRHRLSSSLLGFALCLLAFAARAEPVLSIAGTMDASGDYAVVLDALDAADADATTLTLHWDLMETDGTYAPDPNWPMIADVVYPARNLQLGLVFAVIDTVADRRPVDLQQKAFSDPDVIARFEDYVTQVLTAMPEVTLTSVAIGNEVDVYLDGDAYDDYAVFFAAASDIIRRLVPDVPVGTTVTWAGVRDDPKAQALAALGDVWMVNYYPVTPEFQTVPPSNTAAVLTDMLMLADRAPVMLTETGYPSGGCGGTSTLQLAYVQQVLQFATLNAARMPLVNLVWLHNIPQDAVTRYADYYGDARPCFADFLSTLGLRSHSGADKPVFSWLKSR